MLRAFLVSAVACILHGCAVFDAPIKSRGSYWDIRGVMVAKKLRREEALLVGNFISSCSSLGCIPLEKRAYLSPYDCTSDSCIVIVNSRTESSEYEYAVIIHF
jgi:hypothetical protein